MHKIHLSSSDVLMLKISKYIKIKNRKRLSKHGLIVPAYKNDADISEKPKYYKLSDRGVDYLLYRKNLFRNSVFTPIAVSIITNLVLDVLQWLLKQIQQSQ